ncbi:MAG: sigma-54-dependent Fis family transcriptional regulator [Proteobacteria bacterium]|nr:MAG: sigma-54-dependent Fis family transcriptional regulator [Pseudomonadota bacterium]
MATARGNLRRGSEAPAASPSRRVLVVDDAEGIRTYLANLLELRGFQVDTAEDGRRALALLEAGANPDVVLMDVMMPGMDGLETLRRMHEAWPRLPIVILSVVGRASTIVQAMQLGAADYLNKPFEEEELEATLRVVLETRELEQERARLLEELEEGTRTVGWQGEAMRGVRALIEQIAGTDVTVLITGESGVGKEVVAREIHRRSPRTNRPFVKVNCAALPEDLLESELFGYERGAFTGAVSRKPGKFEVADTGTMFLDEIGEMSPPLQAKLLQVLQDATFARLGGNREIRVDVRVLCATNRSLEQMVKVGSFREDLYYRLNVVDVRIPPLRERREEVPVLVDAFLRRFAAKYGKPLRRPSPALAKAMERYPFPGNVRELENLMKRVVVLESEDTVLADLLGGDRMRGADDRFQSVIEELAATAGQVSLKEVGRRAAIEAERATIDRVLHRTHWNRKAAARVLGVSYKTLLQKIRECGLEEA